MDALLIRQAVTALDRALAGATLAEVLEEPGPQVRLVFDEGSRRASVTVGLRPARPWLGRPPGTRTGARPTAAPFVAGIRAALKGAVLAGVEQPRFDRVAAFRFRGGAALLAELAPHRANLVRLDEGGRVAGSWRLPRASRERLAPGRPYALPPRPPGRRVPDPEDPGPGIREALEEAGAEGVDAEEALGRRLLGIGRETARLVLEESRHTGRPPAEVLSERLASLARGELADPAVAGPGDPVAAAEEGTWDPGRWRLLPWEPPGPADGSGVHRGEDAAATAGLYHGAADLAEAIEARVRGLRSILERELRRAASSRERALGDLRTFADPERHRRWGEALLAGLRSARRAGDCVVVPDPYDPGGGELRVPVPPGASATAAADHHFRQHRRALRGLAAARERAAELERREDRLAQIRAAHEGRGGREAAERLERAMREAGIPVGLAPATRRGRARAAAAPPRLEGVRIYTSADDLTILVGKGSRANDRLTFKLASPEDFWFHARGSPGAHVVVRNPERLPRPPRRTLLQAAALAAWFSDQRGAAAVDVQWTRRKHVRKPRGARPGTVLLKRAETVRVRPAEPAGGAGKGPASAPSRR